jgi:hypothetical protein
MCATGEPPLTRAQECLDWHKLRVSTRYTDSVKYKVPLIISEFGACTASEACAKEIQSTTEACDDYQVGWAYWEYKKFHDITTTAGLSSEGVYEDDGTLQTRKVKALARTYAKAIQGTPSMIRFNSDNGAFSLTFTYDATITAPTIVFRSTEFYYPNGYTVLVFDAEGLPLSGSQVTINPRANYVNDIEVLIID